MENNLNVEFLELYEPIHAQFLRYCRAISGNLEDAKDLVNDSILVTLESFSKIKDKSAFKSYLFVVATNLNRRKFRRKKFKAEFRDAEFSQLIDLSQNQEYIADFKFIYELILSLPERTANTLLLYHISDLTLQEIQKIQGGSLSGVKLRLKRGREKLLSRINSPQRIKTAMLFLSI